MSGGSYNYLCYKDADEIPAYKSELNKMRDRLTQLGHLDAAKETESILLMLDAFEVRLQARIDRLRGVWQAVEWDGSMDGDEDDIKEAVEKYRNL